MKKKDLELLALYNTDRFKFNEMLSLGEKSEKLELKKQELKQKAVLLYKQISNSPAYQDVYKKLSKMNRKGEL